MLVERALLIVEPDWQHARQELTLAGETVIGGPDDDLDVGAHGPSAVVEWRDGAWRVRPCSPHVELDDVVVRDETPLRHGQVIQIGPNGPRVQFLVGERERELADKRHHDRAIDPLTRLLHRKFAYSYLRKQAQPSAVLLIDIDWMKRINDQHGMMAGNATLRRTAGILRAHVAWPGMVMRFGGEEFVIVLPRTGLEDARALAERIRAAAEPAFEYEDVSLTATLSIGLAMHGTEIVDTLRAADEALGQAKVQGRNRVVG